MAVALVACLAVSLRATAAPLAQECPVAVVPGSGSVRSWSVAEVAAWAGDGGDGAAEAVVTHAIDGPALLLLSRRDLAELNLTQAEHHRLSVQLDGLRRGCSCSSSEADFWSAFEASPYRSAVFGSFVEFAPEFMFAWALLWDSEALAWLWGCTCSLAGCPGWAITLLTALLAVAAPHALVAVLATQMAGAHPFVASSLVLEHTVQQITDARVLWRWRHRHPLDELRLQLWRRLHAALFSVVLPLVLLVLPHLAARVALGAYFAWSWVQFTVWFISEALQTWAALSGGQKGGEEDSPGKEGGDGA
eukprot:Hpha_TRINITY_DN24739_c0_g1::TRINITY_DN24739_c0_g1_i1::g.110295::m.110295